MSVYAVPIVCPRYMWVWICESGPLMNITPGETLGMWRAEELSPEQRSQVTLILMLFLIS